MALRKGTQTKVQAPNTAGVQRAHEGLMQSQRSNTQMAQGLGQATQAAVGDVRQQQQMEQQQGQFDAEMALRKERLDVEMAKGGLQFETDAKGGKVVTQTEEAKSAAAAEADLKQRRVAAEERRAETEALKTHTYLANAQLAALKAGYTDPNTGELTPEGAEQAKTLYKQLGISKARKIEAGLIKGEPDAEKQAKALVGEMPEEAQMDPAAAMKDGLGMNQPMGATDRLIKSVRANIDYKILSGVHASGGILPDHDDLSMESEAMQAFNGWRVAYRDLAKAGRIPLPPFRSNQEKNRYFNKIAAKAVISGIPLPGSMAGAPLTEGIVAAQAPTGQPDDGSQPDAGPPAGSRDPLATPGSFTPDAGGAGQSWDSVP